MLLLPIVVVLLVLMSAAFAASETAIFALARMEHTRAQLAPAVQSAIDRLLLRPLESLIVVIGLNEAANVFAECLATIFLLMWLGPIGAWISVPVMFVLVLLFCDITPKTFALGFPGGVARITARPLSVLIGIVHPIARWFTPTTGAPHPEPLSEEEFKALLHLSEFQGQVEPQERELIHRVFEFGGRRVAEVMTPRDKIFALDIDTAPERVVGEVLDGHFSRIPIYRGNPNNIVGILHVKDLVTRRLEAALPRLHRLIRPAYYVPPGKQLGELFDEMRRGRFQLALVVDEYGRVLGLITLEDLLEELFGEIRDEFDYEGPEVTPTGDGEWLVSGAIEIDKLNEALGNGHMAGLSGPQTLSSLVLRRLGRVPRPGERFRLGQFEAAVERVRGATVEMVRLRR
ncbi:MAG: hemolysin family protein [Candidatus Binataceae bacterium]